MIAILNLSSALAMKRYLSAGGLQRKWWTFSLSPQAKEF